ncbi:hypothetical protein ASPZODRAFT_441866 [Penicilliopsis zonata CBS 506.65]|uniref:Branchpoint-bridging protein n=1 Tax=Penicilliopsis zonata CBS 506.65 TaxID=1073090 RepID=A0A1L9SWU1_9EURO|nr:hypothetical protein ASPZODRAFT_441866 [Penicilliopsis zonata CBS 506.65]OJJ51634.1 hypothetical protein ASPZODRAFT_441866 [Penicilliopsis zonata CBS 506.65]
MSWRTQGMTGSNNIPLGRRRFAGDEPEDESRTATPASAAGDVGVKRGRSPVRDGIKKRKKRNRWGDAQENKAAGLMGLPTMIMANFTNEQLEAYTLHLRIEEISQKLRINDVVPADGDRSPSPPPQYDNFGRRVNTREFRYRKRLEDERHKLVEKAMKTIPNYHPPADYRRPTKTQEKVYVPVNDYPEINFSMITNPLTPNCLAFRPQMISGSRFWLTLLLLLLLLLLLILHTSLLYPFDQYRTRLTLSASCYLSQSWLTHRTSWQHSEEDGGRIRRQDRYSRQRLRQGRKRSL